MALTLQDMARVATLANSPASWNSRASTSSTSRLSGQSAQALEVATKRIGAQISQTNVKLSSYGQIQSGFSSLQSAGKALSALPESATAADVGKAAQSFVGAFNNTNSAIATAVNGTGKAAGTLANEASARLSSIDLRRVATGAVGGAELKSIGISVNQNGSLSLDSKVFGDALQANPDAVKSTLAKLGQQASTVASNELSNTGMIGKAVNSLTTQANNLAALQTQEQNLIASAQAAAQQTSNLFGGFSGSNTAIDTYAKIFSL